MIHRLIILFWCALSLIPVAAAERPNVVFVITDDQGYGDMGFTGNPVIQTPYLDQLAGESVWLKDYHVAPSCSPTRCSLLTGRWTNRTGVWHTFFARAMMYEDEVTIADHLQSAGYSTGMFGKWHLGDHFPYRPQDRGFDEVYCLQGGAIGVTADYWNNDCFDDHYLHNGEVAKADGYCTDVFFTEAVRFIKEQAAMEKPFFAYLSTNAPHKPWICPPAYSDRYEGESENARAFYGMITNIDENIGKLRKVLQELDIAENTIFIFTTDNGSVFPNPYNAGMRGGKISPYEGGHRVPFALHWPAGGFHQHQPVEELTHMVDVLPTLLDLCGVTPSASKPIDGHSMVELLKPDGEPAFDWENRIVVSDSQRVQKPVKWKDSSVMTGKWRLVKGTELYHVGEDPGQKINIADLHPEKLAAMRKWYEDWWAELEPTFSRTSEIYIGSEQSPEVALTALQWIDANPPWNQGLIRKGGVPSRKGKRRSGAVFPGHWTVKVVRDGNYAFEVRRWPEESDLKIREGVVAHPPAPGCLPSYSNIHGRALPIVSATLRIDGEDIETKPVADEDKTIQFVRELTGGSYKFSPYFSQRLKGAGSEDRSLGCYYLTVTRLEE